MSRSGVSSKKKALTSMWWRRSHSLQYYVEQLGLPEREDFIPEEQREWLTIQY